MDGCPRTGRQGPRPARARGWVVLCAVVTGLSCATSTPPAPPTPNPPAASNQPRPSAEESPALPFDFVAVDFVDASTGYALGTDEENGGSVLVNTNDGGATWVVAGVFGELLRDVDFVDAQSGWIAGDAGTRAYTSDGGATWAPAGDWNTQWESKPLTVRGESSLPVVLTENIASLFFADARTGWAAGDAPDPADQLSRRGLLLQTSDGGQSWRELQVPFALNDLWFVDGGDGWAAGGDIENDDVDVLLHTTDGGRTWKRVPTKVAQFHRAVHFVDRNRGWVVGMTIDLGTGALGPSKIVGTTDGGATWTVQLVADRSFLDVTFADAKHGWAVGDRAAIYATTDGGASWQRQANFATRTGGPLPEPQRIARSAQPPAARRPLGALFFVDRTTGWAGGAGVILQTRGR